MVDIYFVDLQFVVKVCIDKKIYEQQYQVLVVDLDGFWGKVVECL